jgi:transposase
MDLTQNKKTPSFEGDGVSAGVEIKSVITPQDFLPGRSSDWARLRFAKLERGFELVVGRMVGVNSAKGRPPSFEGGWRGRARSIIWLIPTPVDSDSEGDSRIGWDLIRWSQTMEFAMPIPLRGDFDTVELRREARKSKDSGQARRLLALAAIYDGSTRTQAAKIGGVTLQIVRDWVMRFNADGPSGLIAGKAPGQTPRLTSEHRAALARMVEDGPIPAVHGVVRWRLVDLCQQMFEAFHVVVSTQTMSRELRAMDYRKLSARPRHHAQATNAIEDFKKASQPAWRKSRGKRAILAL